MSMTNCVNCGSAKDVDAKVCPFCGTSYFDMTDIDLSSRKPCVVRFRDGENTFQIMAIPTLAEFTIHPMDSYTRDVEGRIHRFRMRDDITARIEFASV